MDAETQDLLRGSIRALLTSRPADLLTGLSELGWAEVVSDDEATAVNMLFAEQGRAGVASAALDGVMTADGEVVIHPLGRACATVESGRLLVDGVVLRATPDRIALVSESDSVTEPFVLQPVQWTSACLPITGFDPQSGLHRVRSVLAVDDVSTCAADWTTATAAARRALAAELVGNASAMLDIAVEHVAQRAQFGRPIGANQTPRHRLADSYAQVAAANELVSAAWASRSEWDATVAKAYAGWAAETTARACMQVCGAIGLSLEHALGGYVKRARILDGLYDGWQAAVGDIGRRLLEVGTVPTGPAL